MVAVKFFGILMTFYLFVVLEAFGQNFYAARYGKRDDADSDAEKNMPEGKRLGRRENQEALAERKIRFFISGGRYGKRGCTAENCSQGSKEDFQEPFPSRQDRSERIRIPIRKNQFMMGSRFGKRMENHEGAGSKENQDLLCTFTGVSDFYRCTSREESTEDNEINNSFGQYFH